MEPAGEPGRGDGYPFLGVEDLAVDQGQLGRGAFGVGGAALLGLGVGAGQPGDLAALCGRLAADPQVGLAGEQLEVQVGHFQEDLVGRRRGVEPLRRSTRCRVARGSKNASVSALTMLMAGTSAGLAAMASAPPPT